jgi:hypothetical protein
MNYILSVGLYDQLGPLRFAVAEIFLGNRNIFLKKRFLEKKENYER